MEITRGVLKTAQKVVVYGPEGIGKSTFAAQFPDPLFIDTEGSTKHMNVSRMPKPKNWPELKDEINYVKDHPDCCKTLVIDTIDWAEQLCVEDVCAQHNKRGIEDFGYGNGYIYTKEEFAQMLKLLDGVIDVNINVVLTAHAQIRKFEQPDELGAYDRYELKLGKKTASQTSPLVKEWADMLLFANYKTHAISVDDKGKKHKAQGGKRVMYTAHHPCWDAKNRHGLPEEMPFEYAGIEHVFDSDPNRAAEPKSKEDEIKEELSCAVDETAYEKTDGAAPVREPQNKESPEEEEWEGIPPALKNLMEECHVEPEHIRQVVSEKGYYPADTPIKNYDLGFVEGVLIEAWEQVYQVILENQKLPFE